MSGLLMSTSSPPARQKPRYSVRPFYWALLLFLVLGTLSWALGGLGDDSVVSIPRQFVRRDNVGALEQDGKETEVLSAISPSWAIDDGLLIFPLSVPLCSLRKGPVFLRPYQLP